eukprot:GHVT01088445.1.p1 GENE.GHVT01088445.1~~GHVT01088445.1.p1  ORF type:complete len:146 (+),score=27.64 GHVT01088445.1:789-1226(+)
MGAGQVFSFKPSPRGKGMMEQPPSSQSLPASNSSSKEYSLASSSSSSSWSSYPSASCSASAKSFSSSTGPSDLSVELLQRLLLEDDSRVAAATLSASLLPSTHVPAASWVSTASGNRVHRRAIIKGSYNITIAGILFRRPLASDQ